VTKQNSYHSVSASILMLFCIAVKCQQQSSIICEGFTQEISCGNNQEISITNAVYGRRRGRVSE